MYKARKQVGDKVILDDVTMSFFPGAKIGMVGPNGAGKSTILKIMAGLDEPSNGEARLSPGYSVGILLQEPPLNEEKTVLENVQEGMGDLYAKVQRFNEIGELMGEPDADFDALMAEMGTLQTEIDAANGWDLDSQLEQAMDALRCPPGDEPVTHLSGGERRRVALCKLLLQKPDLLLLDDGHCLRDQIVELCRLAEVRRTPSTQSVTRAASLTTVVQLVVAGLGSTLVPMSAVATECARPGIAVSTFADDVDAKRTVGLAMRTSSRRQPEFEQLGQLVERAFQAAVESSKALLPR